jgi:hypothetical protein
MSSLSGSNNTAMGYNALSQNTTASGNTAVGNEALLASTTAGNNTAVGNGALKATTTGYGNTGVGVDSLRFNTTGQENVAVGTGAMISNTTGIQNTAVGQECLSDNLTYTNTAGLGYRAQVTASNQVQIGGSLTTTYVYGTVQNRSDLRDKADVRDTALGLGFINALRPVDYRWDLRDSYRAPLPDIPEAATDAERASLMAAYLEANALANITRDGSKKRSRYHHGLIAQEVAAVIQATGMDFGGFQDHSIQGGEDVLSLGYDEFVAPLIRAVQELSARVVELEARLSAE